MHVKDLNKVEIIRCLEVMVSRNIGSTRLFDHYILMMIEKHMMKYDVPLYSRLIRALADKGFTEDFVFWDKFAFAWIYEDPSEVDNQRRFTRDQAKHLWNTFVLLKVKCPVIDIRDVLEHLETFIDLEDVDEAEINEEPKEE